MEQRYYWLKLNKDFFKSKRIKKLRKLAGGDTYTIIYLKMQLLATPTEGVLTYTGLEETAAEEIALDIDEDPENVKIVLSFMLKTGLCEILSDTEYLLPYVAENIGSEGSSAKRMRDLRERQKASLCDNNVQKKCAHHYGEKEIDIEIDKDIDIKEKYKKEKPASRKKYGEYNHVLLTDDEYNRLVKDYGEQAVLSGIKNVDEYCQEHGKTYKDYNLTLRKWGIKSPKLPEAKEPEVEKIDIKWQRQFYNDKEWEQKLEEWRAEGRV